MDLPPALVEALTLALGTSPRELAPVGGGDISQAVRVAAGSTEYLVKWHPHPPVPPPGWPDMFTAEALGLQALASAAAVRVPEVVAHSGSGSDGPQFIVLEWIEPGEPADRGLAGAALGRNLARLHRVTQELYGLDHHNYCGASPQSNTPTSSWLTFYGEERLRFQMRLAERRGRMPPDRRHRLEKLIEHLGDLVTETDCAPSLLHGDLWGGNWIAGSGGEPIIIDPAIYFGDREAELAMCRLFGGYPPEFYASYDEAWPPAPGRDERVALYELYHVLNHLNLFGGSYASQVDEILQHYVA